MCAYETVLTFSLHHAQVICILGFQGFPLPAPKLFFQGLYLDELSCEEISSLFCKSLKEFS